MSGPFLPARAGQPFDMLEQSVAGGGWEALEELMKPHLNGAPLQPDEDVAEIDALSGSASMIRSSASGLTFLAV